MKKSTTENEKKMDKTFDKKESKKERKTFQNRHSSETDNQKIIAERVLGLPSEPKLDKDKAWKDIPRS